MRDDYEALARARHSVRAFLPRPVPEALLERLLTTARLAPSGANLQPGRFWAVQGAARERLVAAQAAHAVLRAQRARKPSRHHHQQP